jgi:Domain of unknown function (DUF3331)
MHRQSIAIDPWLQTVGWLIAPERQAIKVREPVSRRMHDNGETSCADVAISIIDRPTASTATVIWCDPRSCRYGNQVWRSGIARRSGVCALTGRCIERGDVIYRPRTCHPSPLNAHAMILAMCVENLAPTSLALQQE